MHHRHLQDGPCFRSMPPARPKDPGASIDNLHTPPFSHSGRERREREQRERQQKLHYKVEAFPQVPKCLFGRHPSEYFEPLFFEYVANIAKIGSNIITKPVFNIMGAGEMEGALLRCVAFRTSGFGGTPSKFAATPQQSVRDSLPSTSIQAPPHASGAVGPSDERTPACGKRCE